MIDFHISNEEYLNDLMELVRPFESRTDVDLKLDVDYFRQKNAIRISIYSDSFDNFQKHYTFSIKSNDEL